MYFRLIIFITLIFLSAGSYAQNDPVLFSVDGEKVGLKEFTNAFLKNNQFSIAENKEATRNFLNNYINYKLKIAEAYKQNLQRGNEIKDLMHVFKEDLIQAYLADKELVNEMVDEVYQRMKTEIKVRHILIKVHRYADPKDTLIAYHKALAIRTSLMSGKNFNELASEVSDAPGAAVDKGEMGYISVFKLPYPIESYIYNTNSEKYSLPIRSKKGYHIVKVDGKRPAVGYFSIRNILVVNPDDTSQVAKNEAKRKIDEAYAKLVSGADFTQVMENYSEDVACDGNSNLLPWFGTGFMPEEIETTCINLQNGEYSRPVKTRFGWHIISKVAHENIPSFGLIREQIENMVIRSGRAGRARRKTINQLKKKHQFKDYQTLSEVWKNVDSTIFDAQWKPDEYFDLPGKLFEFNNRTYFQKDFVNYLKNNQEIVFPISIKNYVYLRYKEFVDKIVLRFEIEQAEKENSEISSQLKDYQESILVNKIMKQEVWSKLNPNTKSLKEYYNKNREKYNTNHQANVTIFKFNEELKKIEKQFKKLKRKNASDQEIVARIKANTDISFDIFEKGIKEEGENSLVDKIIARYKIGELDLDDRMFVFENAKKIIWLNSKVEKTDKSIDEVMELVSNDYKSYFEQNWIKQLKRKYSIVVNEEVFESIFSN